MKVFLNVERLIKDSPFPAFIITRDNRILSVNEAFCNLIGKAKDQIEGKYCYEVVHDERKLPSFCPLREGKTCFLSGCSNEDFKCSLCPQDCLVEPQLKGYLYREFFETKLKRYLRVTLLPIFDDRGELFGYLHFIEDHTEKEELHKFLNLVMNQYPGLFFAVDEHFNVIYMNDRLRELSLERGFQKCYQLIFGRDAPCEDCFFLNKGVKEVLSYSDTLNKYLLKSFHWVNLWGDYTHRVAFYRDITEQVTMFEELPTASFVVTPYGDILKYNQRALEIFKIRDRNFLTTVKFDIFWVDSCEYENFMKTLVNMGQIHNYEVLLKDFEGNPFNALISSKIYQDKGQQIIFTNIQDITSYVGTKEKFLKFVSKILEILPLGVAVIDERDRVLFANQRLLIQTGYTLDELKSSQLHQLLVADETLRMRAREVFEEIAKGRKSTLSRKRVEFLARRKDGSNFPVEVTFDEFYFDKERLFIGTIQDITERKIFEDRLIREEKEFVIEKVAGGLAHDLNNTLMIVKGYLELLHDLVKDHGERERQYLEKISFAFDRIKNLVDELFILSKGEFREAHITNISDFLKAWVPFFVQGTGVKLHMDIEPELHYPIKESHLLSLVQNVVVNAKEAMKNVGELTVRAKKRDDSLILEFIDTGPGISPDVLPRIFDPGFSTKPHGSGLGLFVVKRVTDMYDGSIEIFNQSEGGVRVVFKFPLSKLSFKPEKEFATTKYNKIKIERPKVLILDDEDEIREVLSEFLLGNSFKVETAENGDVAFQKIKESILSNDPITHLLLDLTVPQGKGGVYLLKKLSEEGMDISKFKVILMTGYTEREIQDEVKDLKVDEILYKPFSLSNLLESIEKTSL